MMARQTAASAGPEVARTMANAAQRAPPTPQVSSTLSACPRMAEWMSSRSTRFATLMVIAPSRCTLDQRPRSALTRPRALLLIDPIVDCGPGSRRGRVGLFPQVAVVPEVAALPQAPALPQLPLLPAAPPT